jgi:hypothetical protein
VAKGRKEEEEENCGGDRIRTAHVTSAIRDLQAFSAMIFKQKTPRSSS